MYSASHLRVLAAVVFPLSLCTQPPCFRGGRFAGVATSFRLVCVEEDSGTLWLLRLFQWGEFFLLGQSLVLVVFLFLVLVSSTSLCSLFTVVAVRYFCSSIPSAVCVCFS